MTKPDYEPVGKNRLNQLEAHGGISGCSPRSNSLLESGACSMSRRRVDLPEEGRHIGPGRPLAGRGFGLVQGRVRAEALDSLKE